MERTLMHRYKLIAVSSADQNTIVIYSPEDQESILREFTPVDDIQRTGGFIDDKVQGDHIYEYTALGLTQFRDRNSALDDLYLLTPDLGRMQAAILALELKQDLQKDITEYGYKLHNWHPLNQ